RTRTSSCAAWRAVLRSTEGVWRCNMPAREPRPLVAVKRGHRRGHGCTCNRGNAAQSVGVCALHIPRAQASPRPPSSQRFHTLPEYRSRTSTHGRNMAGARALWRATGMRDADFHKPIVAIANSFTQFVPGHVHLKDMGQLVAREIERVGGVAKEFNTIAVDDGIAMGHDGMLYSLPSRELIADAVEYMVNAHCADALVCISNCDKITPGMLMAAMRLNVPTVFVSGGP